jgi:hypothetical protein
VIAVCVKLYTNRDATGKKAGDIGKTVNSVKIVSWSNGTDAQIVAMVKAADAGKIKLSDYWNVGEKRKVTLSAMSPSCGLPDSHSRQTVELVLMNVGGRTLCNGKQCSFIVGQKDCLNEPGKLNPNPWDELTWNKSNRRTWVNTTYRNAIPSTLRPVFKKFKVVTLVSKKPTYKTTYDYFTLPGRFELPFDRQYPTWKNYAKEGSAIEYYQLSSEATNKFTGKKHLRWWTRSMYDGDGSGLSMILCNPKNPSCDFSSSSGHHSYGISPYGVI